VTVCAGATLIAGASAQVETLPQQTGSVDLLAQANVRMEGAAPSDLTGTSVAAAGDVNGDGIGDVIIGAEEADAAFVVFGRPSMGTVSLAALGDAGFRMNGALGDLAGSAVARAGDMNGDGLADVMVGATGAKSNAGAVYVVFGRRTGGTVDLANLGSGGFEIDGAAGDSAGYALAGGADVNGDGRPDAVVGAPGAGPNGECSGRVYVVYGKASTTPVSLSAGFAGFRMDGAAAGDEAGYSVGMAGDMTGDGLSEVIVGAPSILVTGCGPYTQRAGAVYVIFGGPGAPNLSLGDPGFSSYGFTIYGAAVGEDTGFSVAGAGDVSGDGHTDVLVGDLYTGRAYVIFGRGSRDSTPIYLSAFGGGGFAISSAAPGDWVGCGVAAAGDVNGDGRADVLLGAGGADYNGRTDSGSAYVVYGTAFPQPVNLGALGSGGFRIDGPEARDVFGCEQTVAAAGDFNGDGRPDLIVGAPEARNEAGARAGVAYIVYGFGTPELAYASSVAATMGKPLSPVKPTRLRRTGEPSFAISPKLPASLTLDTKTGVLSGTPQATQQKTSYTVTMTDLAGQATATLSIEVKAPAPPPPPPPPTVRPKLIAGKLTVGKAIAGKAFTVSTTVKNSKTGHTVKGQVACTGKLSGKPLRATHHSSKTNGKTSCTWQLPKTAHGKHFTGTITDTYNGARISRSFSVKVA
jgi:hypothetical protein